MVKKLLLSLCVLIGCLSLLVVGYVFWNKAERPKAPIKPVSLLYKAAYKKSATEAEKWLVETYHNHLFPSLSVSVGVKGQVVWDGVIGYSDLDRGLVADANTRYRIGSISKSITAAAFMRMQEKKIINLEQKFSDYVKDYAPGNGGFSLKHLLTHQAGVRHYKNMLTENFSRKEYANTREAAVIVEHDPLMFAPGQNFNYSTYGYTLLSLAMEMAYSLPFENIMHQEVFSPAGMSSTLFDKVANKKDKAASYLEIKGSLYDAPDVNVSYKYAGGGYLSTPSDVVRFSHSLMNKTLLTPQSIEQLWSPVALESGQMNPENYALGFRVGQDELGQFVHHGGKSVGGVAFLLIYPESEIVVAFAANVTPGGNSINRIQAAQNIAKMFNH